MPWITITYSHGQAELDQTFEGLQMAMRKISGVVATGRVRESFEGDPIKPVFRSFNQCLQSRCARLHRGFASTAMLYRLIVILFSGRFGRDPSKNNQAAYSLLRRLGMSAPPKFIIAGSTRISQN